MISFESSEHVIESRQFNDSIFTVIFVHPWAACPPQADDVFGKKFADRNRINADFIYFKNKPIWYHDIELIKYCRNHYTKDNCFYGASMGGYGAIHLAKITKATYVSASPQVEIFGKIRELDERWIKEWSSIRQYFDEKIQNENRSRQIYHDNLDALDSIHANIQKEKSDHSDGFYSVPYTGHTTIRNLVASGVIKSILTEFSKSGQLTNPKMDLHTLWSYDVRSKLNYYRKNIAQITDEVTNNLLLISQSESNFENLYMLAEIFSSTNRIKEALLLSRESVKINPKEYVIKKHMSLLNKIGVKDIDAELDWINQHKS